MRIPAEWKCWWCDHKLLPGRNPQGYLECERCGQLKLPPFHEHNHPWSDLLKDKQNWSDLLKDNPKQGDPKEPKHEGPSDRRKAIQATKEKRNG